MRFILLICKCGNSKSIKEEICLHYPNGSIVCGQLTKERTICINKYSTGEILKKVRHTGIADFSQPELIQESLIK